jgi:hypothetical protein
MRMGLAGYCCAAATKLHAQRNNASDVLTGALMYAACLRWRFAAP